LATYEHLPRHPGKFAVRISTLFRCFSPEKPAHADTTNVDNVAVSNQQSPSAPGGNLTELTQRERGRAQILRRAIRHDPISCINSAVVNQTLTKVPNHVTASLGMDNVGFTVYSFGRRPNQNIKCLEKRSESKSRSEIPQTGDVKHVEPGDTESGRSHLFSRGFVNCTPVVAFYGNGGMAMHHSARYTSFLPSDMRKEAPTPNISILRT
jgi:hypothetical protein